MSGLYMLTLLGLLISIIDFYWISRNLLYICRFFLKIHVPYLARQDPNNADNAETMPYEVAAGEMEVDPENQEQGEEEPLEEDPEEEPEFDDYQEDFDIELHTDLTPVKEDVPDVEPTDLESENEEPSKTAETETKGVHKAGPFFGGKTFASQSTIIYISQVSHGSQIKKN